VLFGGDAWLRRSGRTPLKGSVGHAYQNGTFVSDFRQPAIGPVSSLDPVSRRRVAGFVFRFLVFAMLTYEPCLTNGRSIQGANALLTLVCALAAIVSMVFAKLSREPFGQGSLNRWDEALAFVAVSRLTHFAADV